MATTTIGIKVDEATRDRLRALAHARNRSPHWVARTALLEYLAREEVQEHERREDQERWDRYVLTGEAIPHARVRGWLTDLAAGEDAECPR
jgi:predicted transcriptional regulator